MATIIDDIPVTTNERNAKYPWTEWFDGQARMLAEGEDFTCKPASFVGACYIAAKKHGVKLTITRGEGGVLYLRAQNV